MIQKRQYIRRRGYNKEYKYDATVIEFVNGFWRRNFHSPTLREIMDGCAISSTSVARNVVQRVARKNDWRLLFGGPRCITPTWVIRALQKG